MKYIKYVGIVLLVSFVAFLLIMFQPWIFLPHNHIVIALPFPSSYDSTTGLIPMGEKIEHNEANGNPDGHAGIDFGFNRITPIVSASDGFVSSVVKDKEGGFDLTVISGYYKITYKEMNSVENDIHMFVKVLKGRLLGYSGVDGIRERKPQKGDPSRQIHWEFSSSSMLLDRLCPLNYFDEESKKRIEKIWNTVPANDQFKKLYPDICNGVFKDKED